MIEQQYYTVSVLMPTFNRSHLLREVISSVLEQDYRDFELLIVDDGSTDNTEQLIREMQSDDVRLRYIKLPENKGIGYARKIGIESTSSKYVALADSDDVWIPGKLKTQVEILEKYEGIDILFGDFLDIDYVEGTEKKGFIKNAAGMSLLSMKKVGNDVCLIDDGVDKGIIESNFIAVPTMLIRRSIFSIIGNFNSDLRGAADHEFGFRAAVLGAKFAFVDSPLIFRYRHNDSDTANTIVSNLNVIKALNYCLELTYTLHREDLTPLVNNGIKRTWIYVMYGYGKIGNPPRVLVTYRHATSYGTSLKDFILFLVCLVGPIGFSTIAKIRKLFKNEKK